MNDYNPNAFAISVTLLVDHEIPQDKTYDRLRVAMVADGNPKLNDEEIFAIAEGKGGDKTPKTNAEALALINEYSKGEV